MAQRKSDSTTLRESVHSLAEALKLTSQIFQGQGAAFNSEPFKKFSALVDDVLAKTSKRI